MRCWPRFLFAAALITLLVVPMAASGQKGTDRPFKATLTGSAHWESPGDWPSDCQMVTTVTDATGQATHLGRVVMSASHCPAEPDYVIDGRLTLTAKNGDMLSGRYDYDPNSESQAIAGSWTGGTGRFEGASGAAVLTYTVVPQFKPGCTPDPDNPFPCYDFTVPWPWSATITGTVTY